MIDGPQLTGPWDHWAHNKVLSRSLLRLSFAYASPCSCFFGLRFPVCSSRIHIKAAGFEISTLATVLCLGFGKVPFCLREIYALLCSPKPLCIWGEGIESSRVSLDEYMELLEKWCSISRCSFNIGHLVGLKGLCSLGRTPNL